MCDSLSLRLLILSSLLLSFGLSAVAADPEEAALVVPVRLTEDEVHLLMDAAGRSGHRRGRRSLSQQGSRRLEQSQDLFLLLPAFGTDLFLHLRRDAGFLSEDFVIEDMLDNGTAPAKSYPGPGVAFCFYTGRVLNHTSSFATLSTCGGLTGWVQTEHDSMFIEPTASSGTFAGVEHKVIRRRRSPRAGPPHMETEMTKHCETIQGKKKEKKTKEWEDRRERRNVIRRGGDYTVETVVVADSDMVAYHGPEAAQRFILTVMNMACTGVGTKRKSARLSTAPNGLPLWTPCWFMFRSIVVPLGRWGGHPTQFGPTQPLRYADLNMDWILGLALKDLHLPLAFLIMYVCNMLFFVTVITAQQSPWGHVVNLRQQQTLFLELHRDTSQTGTY